MAKSTLLGMRFSKYVKSGRFGYPRASPFHFPPLWRLRSEKCFLACLETSYLFQVCDCKAPALLDDEICHIPSHHQPVIFGENIDEKRNSHGTPLTTDKDAAGTCMAYVDTPPVHVVPKDKRESLHTGDGREGVLIKMYPISMAE